MEKHTTIKKLVNGNLVIEVAYKCDRAARSRDVDDYDAWVARLFLDRIEVPSPGNIYMVCTRDYQGPNEDRDPGYGWAPDNGKGWPGNSDSSICRYHGWRGTTDDWAVYGEGVRKCVAVIRSGSRSRRIRIVFGRDLKKAEA